jgi:hypothetical protein
MTDEAHRRALDLADAGDWDSAHAIVQDRDDPVSCWIHANLHREEGDHGNAAYWYRRAGRSASRAACPEERRTIRQGLDGGARSG